MVSAMTENQAQALLLIEGIEDLAEATCLFLQSEGHVMHWVPTAHAAIDYLRVSEANGEKPVDLILLGDLTHKEDVDELLDLLGTSEGEGPFVLLFSAETPARLAHLSRRLRALGFVGSPYRLDELSRLVSTALSLRTPEREG